MRVPNFKVIRKYREPLITTGKGFKSFVGTKFFGVTFQKLNGESRQMHCKFVSYRRNQTNGFEFITVWDLKLKEYRSFRLHSLQEVRAHGMKIDFTTFTNNTEPTLRRAA